MNVDSLVQTLVGSLGPTGLLGWFLWYTTTVTLPRKDAEHNATIDKILTDEREFREREMAELRATFRCGFSDKD